MKSCFCILIWLLIWDCAKASHSILIPDKETPLKILEAHKHCYLLTDKNLYLKKARQWLKIQNRDTVLKYTTAMVHHDTLWLGTSKGLYIYRSGMIAPEVFFIDSMHTNGEVTGLALDAGNCLWVSIFNKGAFRKFGHRFELLLDVNSTSALSATPNGDVWIGSDVGLYQYNLSQNKWTRYAEEGVSGAGDEIPDNIVEHIFSDRYSNTWVVMPDYFTLISGEKGKEHLSFGGRSGNRIESVYSIYGFDATTFLFFSSKGILAFVPASDEKAPSNEVHAAENQKLIHLETHNLLTSLQKDETLLFISPRGKENCWLASNRAVYALPKKSLKRLIKEAIPAGKFSM